MLFFVAFEKPPIEAWLESIKMKKYSELFVSNGYWDPQHAAAFSSPGQALYDIGVTDINDRYQCFVKTNLFIAYAQPYRE